MLNWDTLAPSLRWVCLAALRILSRLVKRSILQMSVHVPLELALWGKGIQCSYMISILWWPKLGNHFGRYNFLVRIWCHGRHCVRHFDLQEVSKQFPELKCWNKSDLQVFVTEKGEKGRSKTAKQPSLLQVTWSSILGSEGASWLVGVDQIC